MAPVPIQQKPEPFKAAWLQFRFSKIRTTQSRMAPVPIQKNNPNFSKPHGSGSDSTKNPNHSKPHGSGSDLTKNPDR
jgi:hypothetical protein